MALVRVYCGLASADSTARQAEAQSRLTVAVVDDAGRLLDVCEVSDDPAGYAQLGALLVERSSGPTGVAIAADSDDHLVTSLLTAAGRPLAIADDDAVDDYAERFADDESVEEMESPAAERRAVGLARALQAGALSAVVLPVPRDLLGYKPVLAAHAALCNGRLSAAVALREVLRELYPAALRAYPDPAEPVSLAVLDALPEPGMLGAAGGRGHDSTSATDEVVARLAADGVADADTVSDKITALRVAIAETPRRGALGKTVTPAIAETVRQAVAAVRACDLGCEALVTTLSARLTTPPATRRTVRRAPAGAPAPGLHAVEQPAAEPAPTRVGRRRQPEPAAASAAPAKPQPITTPPVAPAPVSRPPVAPPPVNRPAPGRPAPAAAPMAPAASVAPPTAPMPSAPMAPAAATETAVRPPVAPPPVNRPVGPAAAPSGPPAGPPMHPMAPAAISAPTPLPIRSSALPVRPAAHVHQTNGTHPTNGAHPTSGVPAPMAPHPEVATTRPVSAPPPPPPGITPIVPAQRTLAPADSGEPFRATLTTAAINSARAERQRPTPIPPRPSTRPEPAAPAASFGGPASTPAGSFGGPPAPAGSFGGPPTPSPSFGSPPAAFDRPTPPPAPFGGSTPPPASFDRPTPPPASFGGTTPPPAPFGASDLSIPLPAQRPAPEAPPGSRANWPLIGSSDDDRSRPVNGDRPYSSYSDLDRPVSPAAERRVTPPWQADDLPPEPPTLRLVEPPPLADRALRDDRIPAGSTPLDAPSLRLVDSDGGARTPRSRRAVERSAVPVAEEGDGDLLIFAQTRSAWFIGHPEEETQLDWTSSADTGWRAAEQAARPAVGAETTSGLPRRVPQANLVPGSPLREQPPLRIVRDAQSIAAHTSGYFRGWRRGQEIGGYAVGGRPGRESAGGWDFSRDSVGRDDPQDYEYRPATYR